MGKHSYKQTKTGKKSGKPPKVVGESWLFSVDMQKGGLNAEKLVKKRIFKPTPSSQVAWIPTNNHNNMQQKSSGAVCAFRESGGDWKLGIISRLHRNEEKFHVWEWKGMIDETGVPNFIKDRSPSKSVLKKHFRYRKIKRSGQVELIFLNQVSGPARRYDDKLKKDEQQQLMKYVEETAMMTRG